MSASTGTTGGTSLRGIAAKFRGSTARVAGGGAHDEGERRHAPVLSAGRPSWIDPASTTRGQHTSARSSEKAVGISAPRDRIAKALGAVQGFQGLCITQSGSRAWIIRPWPQQLAGSGRKARSRRGVCLILWALRFQCLSPIPRAPLVGHIGLITQGGRLFGKGADHARTSRTGWIGRSPTLRRRHNWPGGCGGSVVAEHARISLRVATTWHKHRKSQHESNRRNKIGLSEPAGQSSNNHVQHHSSSPRHAADAASQDLTRTKKRVRNRKEL